MQVQSEGFSHKLLCGISVILMIFSLGSGAGLMASTGQLKGLSGLDGINIWIIVAASFVTVAAVLAIVCSWK